MMIIAREQTVPRWPRIQQQKPKPRVPQHFIVIVSHTPPHPRSTRNSVIHLERDKATSFRHWMLQVGGQHYPPFYSPNQLWNFGARKETGTSTAAAEPTMATEVTTSSLLA